MKGGGGSEIFSKKKKLCQQRYPSKDLRSFHIFQIIYGSFSLKISTGCFNLQTFRSGVRIFLSSTTDLLDHHLKTYEDFIVIGDFNESETSPAVDSVLSKRQCKNIIKNKT